MENNCIDHDQLVERTPAAKLRVAIEWDGQWYYAAFQGKDYPGVVVQAESLPGVLNKLSDSVDKIEKLRK